MPTRVFLLIFGSFWTAITGIFLVMALSGLVNQIRARSLNLHRLLWLPESN